MYVTRPDREDTATAEDRHRRKVKIVSALLSNCYSSLRAGLSFSSVIRRRYKLHRGVELQNLFLVNPFSSILGIWTTSFWAQKLRDILYCTIAIFLVIRIPITVCCLIDIADTIDLSYLPTSCVPLFLASAAPTRLCRLARNRWNRGGGQTHLSRTTSRTKACTPARRYQSAASPCSNPPITSFSTNLTFPPNGSGLSRIT